MITSRSSPELRSIPEGVPPIHDKEIMVFMNGLPKTKRIKLLHESMFVNGEKIFGKKPSLINIYEDSNHVSTGKGYFEFEDHNIKDIIQKSNGYKLDKKHILLTTQCKKCPSLIKYTYLESYGAWRRIWTEEELDNMSLNIIQEPEIENAYDLTLDMIIPTQEEYLGYWKKLTDYIYTCNYSSPTSPGSIIVRIESHDAMYELVRNKHPYICNNPLCVGIFHKKNSEDGGASKKYTYPILPIYEATESLIRSQVEYDYLCYNCVSN